MCKSVTICLTKKSLLKYAENEKAVSASLSQNDINISKEENLKKVVEFIDTITHFNRYFLFTFGLLK